MGRIRRKIRVMIVEDSKLYQVYLKQIIEADEALTVVGIAATQVEAMAMVETLLPDVITLDLNLPDVRDYELLRKLTAQYQMPIIVVTSDPTACEAAMEIGATDFIEKIQPGGRNAAEQFELLLKLKIKMLAQPKRQVVSRETAKKEMPKKMSVTKSATPSIVTRNEAIIAIGASLGGTEATLDILRRLPENMPGILVVQHMPEGFTNAYALRLDKNCRLKVKEAENGDKVLPGEVLVAKGGEQMLVYPARDGNRIRLLKGQKRNGFSPSVDVLFESMAALKHKQNCGVILTGMGSDGAKGLKQLHDTGAYTIGQEKSSCAVYGMPGAAMALGAVDIELTPESIAQLLIERYQKEG